MNYARFKSSDIPESSSKEKSPEELRMFSRFRVNFPTRFRNLNLGKRGEGQCTDIGAGGIGIETSAEVGMKTPVEMWIDVSDGFDPINLKGGVVWSKKLSAENCRLGIVFDCPRLIAFSRVLKMLRR